MEQNKIEIKDMNLYYGDFHALHDIDLNIKENRTMIFLFICLYMICGRNSRAVFCCSASMIWQNVPLSL